MSRTKAKVKLTKADRLARLRKKVSSVKLGGSNMWFKPKVGTNVIRVLPAVNEDDFFFQEVGRHYLPNKQTVYCPDFTSDGELECPVCEIVSELYATKDKSLEKLANSIRVRKEYWMWVLDLSEGGDPKKPLILTSGVMIFGEIVSIIQDPEYGDITDLDEGTNIKIIREGTGLDTSYKVLPARRESAVKDADAVMDKCKSLMWVELTENPEEDAELKSDRVVWVLPYDRIVEEYGLDAADVVAALHEKPKSKTKLTVKKSEGSDSDDGFDDDEDENETEDEDEVLEELKRRRDARSKRRRRR